MDTLGFLAAFILIYVWLWPTSAGVWWARCLKAFRAEDAGHTHNGRKITKSNFPEEH